MSLKRSKYMILFLVVGCALAAYCEPYVIGPEDVIRIQVWGHDDLARTQSVATDGTFLFPLLGKVTAAGLTCNQLSEILAQGLIKGYINEPQVSVVVVEYNSKKVYVLGEVRRPGVYTMKSSKTLIELIAELGGTTEKASDAIIIMRKSSVTAPTAKKASTEKPKEKKPVANDKKTAKPETPGNPKPSSADTAKTNKPISIRLSKLLSGDLRLNIELRGGDIVLFPKREDFNRKVYVAGDAARVGPVGLTEEMTLAELLTIVGTPISEDVKVTVYKSVQIEGQEPPTFTTKEVLLQKAASNLKLEDGDILFFKKDARTFYVVGEVKAPGGFYYREDLTVREAIVLAGWITQNGSSGRVKALRLAKGKWVERHVKMEDKVKPGDIISVPERWF